MAQVPEPMVLPCCATVIDNARHKPIWPFKSLWCPRRASWTLHKLLVRMSKQFIQIREGDAPRPPSASTRPSLLQAEHTTKRAAMRGIDRPCASTRLPRFVRITSVALGNDSPAEPALSDAVPVDRDTGRPARLARGVVGTALDSRLRICGIAFQSPALSRPQKLSDPSRCIASNTRPSGRTVRWDTREGASLPGMGSKADFAAPEWW